MREQKRGQAEGRSRCANIELGGAGAQESQPHSRQTEGEAEPGHGTGLGFPGEQPAVSSDSLRAD